jgi:hypothetical protein
LPAQRSSWICSGSGLSSVAERTCERCTPRCRCEPEQSMQIKMARFNEIHSGLGALQSAHNSLPGSSRISRSASADAAVPLDSPKPPGVARIEPVLSEKAHKHIEQIHTRRERRQPTIMWSGGTARTRSSTKRANHTQTHLQGCIPIATPSEYTNIYITHTYTFTHTTHTHPHAPTHTHTHTYTHTYTHTHTHTHTHIHTHTAYLERQPSTRCVPLHFQPERGRCAWECATRSAVGNWDPQRLMPRPVECVSEVRSWT